MKRKVYETCAVCDEPIYLDEDRYEMPDGDVIHEDCLYEWAEFYHRMGEEDLGYDE